MHDEAAEAEIRMSEVLSSISPATTSLVLVADHEHEGFEVFSRYSNVDTAMLLLSAAQAMLGRAESQKVEPGSIVGDE